MLFSRSTLIPKTPKTTKEAILNPPPPPPPRPAKKKKNKKKTQKPRQGQTCYFLVPD